MPMGMPGMVAMPGMMPPGMMGMLPGMRAPGPPRNPMEAQMLAMQQSIIQNNYMLANMMSRQRRHSSRQHVQQPYQVRPTLHAPHPLSSCIFKDAPRCAAFYGIIVGDGNQPINE
jgi:hypothetical protein